MDRRLIAFLLLAVFASGCVEGGSQGQGVEIVEFNASDEQLTPGQEARIDLLLRNHHTGEISLEDISLYNTAFLEVDNKVCRPESLQSATEEVSPEMECSWTVTAPEDMQGLESRPVTLQLNLEYRSEISNRDDPVQVEFRELSDIDNRAESTRTYSNGEVRAGVSYENPVPEEGLMEFEIVPQGSGEVASGYDIDYSPEDILQNCVDEYSTVDPTVGDSADYSCEISSSVDNSPVTRNMHFSISYKYVKSPSLDIEVVKP